MIKPEELKVGNYILYNGKGLLFDEEQARYFFDVKDEWVYLDPIPLTYLILEQFGFVPEDDSFSPTFIIGNFTINFAIHNGTIQYYGDRIIDTGGDEFLQDIMPLHRFQNLYHALTGEELKLIK